jgi:hypothetical protein
VSKDATNKIKLPDVLEMAEDLVEDEVEVVATEAQIGPMGTCVENRKQMKCPAHWGMLDESSW